MKKEITKIDNCAVFIGGNNHIGKAEEASVTANYRWLETKPLGMIGAKEFFSGVDTMEAKIKWNSFYPDVFKQVANPRKAFDIQLRSNLEHFLGDELTEETGMQIFLRGKSSNFPGLAFKQGEMVDSETTVKVTYVKLVHNNETIIEIDKENEVFNVAGEDVLSNFRANLGG